MPRKSNATAVTIGIDPGKNTFHLIGLDAQGGIVLREKVARDRIVARLANVPPCLIGIEAGMGTHYVTRELLAVGHDVRQVPPVYAKPFRQTHKNDFRDAHAIAEAVQRPTTRCVPAKTDEQLDLQALHRVRYRLVGQRTAVINQIRSFLLEHGITVRQRLHWLRHALPDILAQRTDVLSPRMVRILEDLAQDWRHLDERIEAVTREIEALSKNAERLSASDDDTGHWPDHLERRCCGDRQWRCLHTRARLCCLARPGPETDVHRRSNDPRAHHQARQSLPSHALHAGRPCRAAAAGQLDEAQLRTLARRSGSTVAPQRAGHRSRQQARPHRMERSCTRSHVRSAHQRRSGLR